MFFILLPAPTLRGMECEGGRLAHLSGLGSGGQLGLSGSLGRPSLLEEGLWDGDLLERG